jgi:2-polyprenyl-6-methoxyphenol hydroxylase-like FAD-dependent oxidoreductase
MAIEDAQCLAGHFSRGAEFSMACHGYQRERAQRTARVQSAAREMGRLNHLSGEAARKRDAALAARDPDDHEGSAWIFEGTEAASSSAPASFFGPAQ